MHPILFEIPIIHFPLRSFGLMVMIGFLVGSHFLTRWGSRGAADPVKAEVGFSALPMWILVGIILGARAMYVVVEVLRDGPVGQGFKEDPLSMLFVWEGGLVMYGGAIGGILGAWWATRKHQIPFTHAMDLGVPAAFLGLAFGRIGCLLVGDDFGSVVPEAYASLPFPITIHVPEVLAEGSLFGPENAGKILWCTQIWMCLNALMLFLIGRYWFLPRRRFGGQVAATLLFIYSFGRFGIEHFRGDAIRGVWFDGMLSTSQLISIFVALITAIYLGLRLTRRQTAEQIGGFAPGQTLPADQVPDQPSGENESR
ncbi:MAG: prolipoprotein diacylglyceryl transferase [Planctomycetota bacterium]|nr:prolipoprotein diacylglyceryl transferase [Planctomycetota bacterium]